MSRDELLDAKFLLELLSTQTGLKTNFFQTCAQR